MDIRELKQILKNSGVAGAGGAGFPSYAKVDDNTETVILNGAECEPLLKVDRQLLKRYSYEIISTLDFVAKVVGARNAVISIKSEYEDTIEAIKAELEYFPDISLKLLRNVYPTGDEVVLIYETLEKIVPPGSFPIDVGVAVFNVETMFNMYKAINLGEGVSTKYLSVIGEVANPITRPVPIGTTVHEVVDLAGGSLVDKPAYIMGGPMTGRLVGPYDVITKTSNAILVLTKEHPIVRKKESKISIELRKASSTCCQCERCTSICPRNLLGYPVEPHSFMRNASNSITTDVEPYINTLYCSSCGLCDMYACPQNLSPEKIMGKYKKELKKHGITTPKKEVGSVKDEREYRQVSMERLVSRLGLVKYNLDGEFVESLAEVKKVRMLLSQSLGKVAVPLVKKDDIVEVGQIIANGVGIDGALSLPVHSSISGKVLEVSDKSILIQSS